MIIRCFLLVALFSSSAFTEPAPEPSPEPSPEPAPAPDPSPDPDPQGGAVTDLLGGVGGLVNNLLGELLGGGGGGGGGGNQPNVDTIDLTLNFNYCNQPLFVTFLTKTDAHCLIDNICFTYFPLPDDPYTFNVYSSTVFADGSLRIETSVVTDLSLGRFRAASPFCTYTSNIIGYAGCDTYVDYREMEYGECVDDSGCPTFVGVSTRCVPLGLSCIDKVEDIVDHAGLTLPDFVILPMQQPNRCVTEQICVNNIQGNFYRALNLPPPGPPAILI